jgi:hypothetical protein
LLGFDEAVRFFVGKQDHSLATIDFEFPVRIRQGSWEALIPSTIGEWVAAGLGVVATTYLATAAKKIADRDFNDVGTREIFKNALRAIQWVIRIGRHFGDVTVKNFDNVRFRKNNEDIGIPNKDGEYIYVPKKFLQLYVESHPGLLKRIAMIVEEDRTLTIGVFEDTQLSEEQLSRQYREIFTREEPEDDILFPELKHGQKVQLTGDITRGNETTNSLGIRYKDHILTMHPESGSVVKYKPSLFLPARVSGTITRFDENGKPTAKRPRIIVSRIAPIRDRPRTLDLFEDEPPSRKK